MAVSAGNITQQTLQDFGIKENISKDGGPTEDMEIKEQVDQSVPPVGNPLPTINEELAKIFPESAHKFLNKKTSGKRGRPRKNQVKPEQKKPNSRRGRLKQVADVQQLFFRPDLAKKAEKRGRPRKRLAVVPGFSGMTMNVTKKRKKECQKEEKAPETTMEREKLRKKPRLSYVDTYIDYDEDEESEDNDAQEGEIKEKDEEKRGDVKHKGNYDEQEGEMKHKNFNEEKEIDVKRKVNNNEQRDDGEPEESNEEKGVDINFEGNNNEQEKEVEEESNEEGSDPSLELSHSECESYDESESGFESDNPALSKGNKRHRRMDCHDEELPKYRILKESEGNQEGLSRYQILKVRLLKFQAANRRGRPSKKIKIAGTKRGRGRPRKNEIKSKSPQDQEQSFLLPPEGTDVKRKRGRPKKVRLEDEALSSVQKVPEEASSSSYVSEKYEESSSTQRYENNSSSQKHEEIQKYEDNSSFKKNEDSSSYKNYEGSHKYKENSLFEKYEDSLFKKFENNCSSLNHLDNSFSQRCEDTIFSQKYEDSNIPKIIEDKSLSQKYEDNSFPQKYEDNSSSQKYEDKSSSQKYEDNSSAQIYENNLYQNESSFSQTCSENEDKKDKKKKKRRKEYTKKDFISQMTSVSVSLQRLETTFNLKSLEDAQKIRVKEEGNGLYEKNDDEDVYEKQEAENNGIMQEKDDTTSIAKGSDKKLKNHTEEQELKDVMLNAQNAKVRNSKDSAETGEDKVNNNELNVENEQEEIVQSAENKTADTAYGTGNGSMDTEQSFDDRLIDMGQSLQDKMLDPSHNAWDSSMSAQDIYLIQEMLSPKRKGRPPNSDPLKKGRDKPRQKPEDPLLTCTKETTVSQYPSGKARGRPKGRKNKQLEYEKLIEDIENKEELNKSRLEERSEEDLNSHKPAEISKSHDKMPNSTSSKCCPSEDQQRTSSGKVSSDMYDNLANFDKELHTLNLKDIFEDNETDIEGAGKITKPDQTISQLDQTGCNNISSNPLPVISDTKTKDCDPLPVGTGSKRKKLEKPLPDTRKTAKKSKQQKVVVTESESQQDRISSQCCSDDKISKRSLKGKKSQSVPQIKQGYKNSSHKKPGGCNRLTQSKCKTKDHDIDTVNEIPASYPKASSDSDQYNNLYWDQSSTSQQSFSGGMLDFQSPSVPDFLDDDYLLAF